MGKTKQITFRATIPHKAAAIDVHGDEGARFVLDISDSDLADFLPVVTMRNKVLCVTVKVDE